MSNKHAVVLKSGCYFVHDGCSASGGVVYDREVIAERPINGGEGVEREFATRKQVDHVELVRKADALVNQARYAIKKNSTMTALGPIADRTQVAAIREEIAGLRREAEAFNALARTSRCGRRVKISVVCNEIHQSMEDAVEIAREIAFTVRSTLGDLHAELSALRDDFDSLPSDRKELTKRWERVSGPLRTRAKNLDKLATGMQRFAVTDAIGCAGSALKELKRAKKEGEKCPDLDFGPIESAIGMFVDLDDDGLSGEVAA